MKNISSLNWTNELVISYEFTRKILNTYEYNAKCMKMTLKED